MMPRPELHQLAVSRLLFAPMLEPPATDLRFLEVGKIRHGFLVPHYQRGYRWGRHEVRALLDDLRDAGEQDYCLQPVVVKRRREDDRFELVDGQQRLTTLFILYKWMANEGGTGDGAPYVLTYETRVGSAEYLGTLEPTDAASNIDFFHMHQAYETVGAWFAERGDQARAVAAAIHRRLGERVKVIWYEVGSDVSSNELFARLNIGRIALTDAELVKALLLAKHADGKARIARQNEIGTQWDAIERELNDPRLWGFLTDPKSSPYPRIGLLFDLMVPPSATRDQLHTFLAFKTRIEKGESPQELWDQVVARHALAREWFEDRELYHDIGFLLADADQDDTAKKHDLLRSLFADSDRLTKREFARSLVARIFRRLDISSDQLSSLAYDVNRKKCARALLLFNVVSTRALGEESVERYPFHIHKQQKWSLEHIHAQKADELGPHEWPTWLVAHENALRSMKEPVGEAEARLNLADEIRGIVNGEITPEAFAGLFSRITSMFGSEEEDEVHGLENLALLQKEANSALNKAAFAVKRDRLLAMDRAGDYIPICTRRVFLKYYTPSAYQQLHLWSRSDRDAYMKAISAALARYLEPAAEAR